MTLINEAFGNLSVGNALYFSVYPMILKKKEIKCLSVLWYYTSDAEYYLMIILEMLISSFLNSTILPFYSLYVV